MDSFQDHSNSHQFVLKVKFPGEAGTHKAPLPWVYDDRGKVCFRRLLDLIVSFSQHPLDPHENTITVTYQDADDDCIIINSTKELLYAVDEYVGVGMLRLVVHVREVKSYPASTTTSINHNHHNHHHQVQSRNVSPDRAPRGVPKMTPPSDSRSRRESRKTSSFRPVQPTETTNTRSSAAAKNFSSAVSLPMRVDRKDASSSDGVRQMVRQRKPYPADKSTSTIASSTHHGHSVGMSSTLEDLTSNDQDVVANAMNCIRKEAQDESFNMWFEPASKIPKILRAMNRFPMGSDIQKDACLILKRVSSEAGDLRFNVISAVVTAMNNHPNDDSLQNLACSTLFSFSVRDDQSKMAIQNALALPEIVGAMRNFPNDANIQRNACRLLGSLASIEYNSMVIGSVGAMGDILDAMRRHKENLELQRCACSALETLSYSENDNKNLMRDEGGIPELLDCLARHSDVKLHTHACRTIGNLAVYEDIAGAIRYANGIHHLVDVMRKHRRDVDLQVSACGALRNLSAVDIDSVVAIRHAGGVQEVIQAINQYPDDLDIQLYGVTVLGNLARDGQNVTIIRDHSGIELIWKAMKTFTNEPKLLKDACTALGTMVLNRKDNAMLLRNVGGIEDILDVMRRYSDDAKLQRSGCIALLNLSVHGDNAQFLSKMGAMSQILDAIQTHPHEKRLQKAGNALLRNLSDNI